MRKSSVGLCLLAAGCATSPPSNPAADAPRTHAPIAATTTGGPAVAEQDIAIAQQIDISAYAGTPTACRRGAASRGAIAVERCYADAEDDDDAIGATFRRIQREEFELMRQRQLLLRQKRTLRDTSIRAPRPATE